MTSVHRPGDNRILQKECKSLADSGWELFLVACGTESPEASGVSVRLVPRPNGRFERMTRSVYRIYREALELDADIYHFHDPELLFAGWLLKRRGKVVLYDVHEDLPQQVKQKPYLPRFVRHTVAKIIGGVERYFARRLDAAVTATPFIRDRFDRMGCVALDVRNYPRLEEFAGSPSARTEAARVCYVGSISPIRGIRKIVEAIEEAPVRLAVGGHFDDPLFRAELQQLPGWGKVDELGFLDRQQAVEVIQQSIAGLVVLPGHTNYVDALPVKMFEYMAAGIPVIASDFPLWRQIVEEARCGILVDPDSKEEIEAAISWMWKNSDKAAEMGRNGRSAVMEKYNWNVESRKLIDLYERLACGIGVASSPAVFAT